jgi:hypothetical protein
MTISRRLGIVLLVGATWLFGVQLGERLLVPGIHSFISTAQAVVGRPLTPVSVAGVARRTSRRCAAGVYNCESIASSHDPLHLYA